MGTGLFWGAGMPASRLSYAFVVTSFIAIFVLFLLGADRGLDLTDESYYLLNYLYLRDAVSSVTFFGAYFQVPFTLLGQNVAGIRLLGFGLLIGSAAYFAAIVAERFGIPPVGRRFIPGIFVLGVVGSVTLYYAFFGTLRSPSYNLLVLVCILFSSGLLIRGLSRPKARERRVAAWFFYGVFISIMAAAKVTSAAAVLLLHFIYILASVRVERSLSLSWIGCCVGLGVVANLGFLWWGHPDIVQKVIHASHASALIQSHGLLGSLTEFRWEAQKIIERHGVALSAPVFGLLALQALVPSRARIIGGISASLGALVLVGWMCLAGPRSNWIVGALLYFLVLWAQFVLQGYRTSSRCPEDLPTGMLLAVLLLLPLAFSFGTNMPLLAHSGMAIIFPLTACVVQSLRLARVGGAHESSPAFVLLIVVGGALFFGVQPWIEKESNYRARGSLVDQNVAMGSAALHPVGGLRLDSVTEEELSNALRVFRKSGFSNGGRLLDLTGDSPGIAYVVGARPVAVPWILGGYKGSDSAAKYLVGLVSREELNGAWLLTSSDNPRAIVGWEQWGLFRTDSGDRTATHEIAGVFEFSPVYKWRDVQVDRYRYMLWRPVRR